MSRFPTGHPRRIAMAGAVSALALVLGASVAAPAAGSSAAARDFTPARGAVFNNPNGDRDEELAITSHLGDTIDSAPRRSVIRFAVFSFSRMDLAGKLVEAHRRGVRVQVLVDDGRFTEAMASLRSELGGDRSRRSFLYQCHQSCRGERGQLHAKFFLFSRAGDANAVVMLGSNNLTTVNGLRQWSDLYTHPNNEELYHAFKEVFAQMVRDTPAESAYVERSVGKTLEAYFLPYPRASAQTDPVHQALSDVSCSGADGGTGYHGRTTIRIAMYAWNGERGVALAREIVDLRRRGCGVRVAYGPGIGRAVKRILGDGGVYLKGLTAATSHVHTKYMIVSGSWGGDTSSRVVWTGSQNWTARSLMRDEATIRVKGLKPFRGYQAHFANLWSAA